VRVALFSGNYNYLREGANQALNRLVTYVESLGHSVRVYSPVTDTPAFEPAGTLVPVPSVQLPVRGEFRLALGLPRAIRRDLEAFAPDIVHVSTPDILDTRAQTYAIARGIPVVASFHTRFETYLDHYGLGWLRPLVDAHLARFYRRSSHVLAPIPALRDELMHLRGDAAVSIWTRGVDRELFSPERRDRNWRRARGIGDDEIALLFFGRLVLEKGAREFVDVVEALQARGLSLRPLVIGAGPAEDLFRALPGAVLTGHLDGEALARAVASADIMFHPSTTEAFGNVLLEAMAAGLAIVAADCPSSAALLQNRETGLLRSPGDVGGHTEAIAMLMQDAESRGRLGKGARVASEAFSWDAASQAVVDAYRGVLEA
jgi:glycosyltransferase involved in cell wall biosynthesis